MKSVIILLLGICYMIPSFAQEEMPVLKTVDSLYREDQFYAGFTFNVLVNRPDGVKQSGFSGGIHLGFIRDMPINQGRNIAIGLGIGYSGNIYNQNLGITEEGGSRTSIFRALEKGSFSGNRFTTNLVEVPLEFRWRTSTPTVRKFWRVYAGFRLGYLYAFKATLSQDGNKIIRTKIEELNRVQLGSTVTFGWNTFNFYFYYSLNSFFNSEAKIDGITPVGINSLKIGLQFYIL